MGNEEDWHINEGSEKAFEAYCLEGVEFISSEEYFFSYKHSSLNAHRYHQHNNSKYIRVLFLATQRSNEHHHKSRDDEANRQVVVSREFLLKEDHGVDECHGHDESSHH